MPTPGFKLTRSGKKVDEAQTASSNPYGAVRQRPAIPTTVTAGCFISNVKRVEAVARLSVDDLATRLRTLMCGGDARTMVGIVGAPGAGKSTLAGALSQQLGAVAGVVGMDGFHLAQAELERLGRAGRKGAPDTFDPWGYAALLRRLRTNIDPVVYAPLFRRDLEEPIANCVAVPAQATCVITEGNYLLMDDEGWRTVREQLDEVWYLDLARELRQERLVRRRIGFGFTEDQAWRWTVGSDERNAETVLATRDRADLVVEVVTR
jgi:pantothenate kinase